MTVEVGNLGDSYLNRLKEGLTVSAVLKAELGAAKSSCGNSRIFAYEGVDDKVIYSYWLAKISSKIIYEPLICRNKAQLIQLWNSLKNDLTGMGENVFFFTDRDFDDLKGYDGNSSIYMTDKYSVENYLVSSTVLEEILKIDLHCHGNISTRKEILDVFENVYAQFLEATNAVNFRIFLARRCKIKQIGEICARMDDLAAVNIRSITAGLGEIEKMVVLEREPTSHEILEHQEDFRLLDRKNRYRGKFSLQFFRKWLGLLLAERNLKDSVFFKNLPQHSFSAKPAFAFDQLAAKSGPPDCFRTFIENVFPEHHKESV